MFSQLEIVGNTVTISRRRRKTKVRNVEAIFIHDGFNRTSYEDNLAVLQITAYESDTLGDILTSIIPPIPGSKCQIIGWGTGTGSTTYEAYKIAATVLRPDRCENYFKAIGETVLCIKGDIACINGLANLLICDDDLSGILSFGYGCDRIAVPNVFTDLSKYNNWIESVLRGAIYSDWKTDSETPRASDVDEQGGSPQTPCVEARGLKESDEEEVNILSNNDEYDQFLLKLFS